MTGEMGRGMCHNEEEGELEVMEHIWEQNHKQLGCEKCVHNWHCRVEQCDNN
jgi:hypothetical protein